MLSHVLEHLVPTLVSSPRTERRRLAEGPSFGAIHLGTVLIESEAAPRRLWAVGRDHEHVVHGLYGPGPEQNSKGRKQSKKHSGEKARTRLKAAGKTSRAKRSTQLTPAGPCGVQVCERQGRTQHAHAGCEACKNPHHGREAEKERRDH